MHMPLVGQVCITGCADASENFRPVHIMRREAQPEALAALRTATSLTPLQQRVFAQRGVTDPAELELTLEQLLPVDAFPACAAAAQLLHEVMQAEQKILLVGDYDADGATGVAVAMRCLRAMGHKAVEYLVPNRSGMATACVWSCWRKSRVASPNSS